MKKIPLILLLIAMSFNCSKGEEQMPEKEATTYHNPVVKKDLPDPTVIKANDGFFYLYATGRHTPIYQSKNLVDWKHVGDAFTDASRPSWEPNGGIWAPDINYINGKYVLYYSMSVWGGEQTCGIGVAVADSPQGPFTDHGMMFRSNTIGVQNSIDQFYIEDGGRKYLVWGSFRGIYCIELSDDGLSLRKGAEKMQIAGTATEGSYIHKRGKYYYLFGSAGTCCEGEKSTYRVVYGRSEKLLGPYLNKSGESMMDNHYEVMLHGGGTFVGTGHNAEFVTDDAGNDWMLYHSYLKDEPKIGRVLMLDQVKWDNDWPYIETSQPSSEHKNPVFGNEKISTSAPIPFGDPYILCDGGKYYIYGTHSADGIEVLVSDDMQNWKSPDGSDSFLALNKKDSYADRMFWAPEIYHIDDKYYMYYSANEHICVATSDKPTGPFVQSEKKPMLDEKGIDNSLFVDTDGTPYLFWVRFNGGNEIWVAELERDYMAIKKETMHFVAKMSQDWERVWPTVNEGPFVVRHNDVYYLTYSANSYESPFYGIGCATTRNIMGDWTKYSDNPILQNPGTLVGVGHHSLFVDNDGVKRIVFHSHNSISTIHPRTVHISTYLFKPQANEEDKFVVSADYFTPKLEKSSSVSMSGNPIDDGWYADPHAVIYDDTYWIYATYSHKYEDQIFMDCFSSKDLVHWQKHPSIIDTASVKWAKKCLWAPAPIRKDGKYYLFFAANDVHEGEIGGIGVGVADAPEGPYKDLLGKPLINEIVNGAQPIDQFVYEENGEYYMYYGGWGHCNVVRLKDDFTGLLPFDNGTVYREITPDKSYVEGSFMVKRNGQYVFMWSEGGWTTPNYCVAYGVSDSPFGPFKRIGTILQSDPEVGTGAGHHSLICLPGTDEWYIFYHRHPLGDTNGNHRQVCIDRMEFESPTSNIIKPVKITKEGVLLRRVD